MKPKYRVGQKYGQITIIGIEKRERGSTHVKYKCSCGSVRWTGAASLTKKTNPTKSCGCLAHKLLGDRSRTHGMSGTPEHKTWMSLTQRCKNPSDKNYHRYKGMCFKEWDSFETFFRDMGPKPGPEYTIDRIDNEKGYSKSNCRWATRLKQARNSRINVMVTRNGVTKCLSEWFDELGVSKAKYEWRIKLGWSREKALFHPLS